MEFITTNSKTILSWYAKQQLKENIFKEIPVMDRSTDSMTASEVSQAVLDDVKLVLGAEAKGDPVLITINPILTRNLCFWNVAKMDIILNKTSKKYERVLGFNITSCPCGKLYTLELHAVLRVIATGEYIDLTTDFGGLTEKWFIPIQFDYDTSAISNIKKLQSSFWNNTTKKHKCNKMIRGRLAEITWCPPCLYENAFSGDREGFKMNVGMGKCSFVTIW